MPELPDLTVYAENLGKAVIGKKVVRAECRLKKGLNAAPDELSSALVSREVADVQRVGKEIRIEFQGGAFLQIHLMLAGGFLLTFDDVAGEVDNSVLTVSFADGSAMVVIDPKGWVKVALNPRLDVKAPDALNITADYLHAVFKKQPKMQVKAFLLDQNLIGGIGNAYADEILWEARISPKSAVGKLPHDAVEVLVESIPSVLKGAIDEIRKRRPNGIISGEVRDFLKVHGPSLKRSPTGSPIIKEQIISKVTYFTDEQILYK